MTGGDEPAGALFVLPTSEHGQLGPIGGWISTSGWAAAAERVLGRAWVATPRGVLTPGEVRAIAATETSSTPSRAPLRRSVPTVVKTAVKDLREWRRARQLHVTERGPWSDGGLEFVWQRHELFHTAGLELADRMRVPSVLFVPALVVSQAEQWGVRRPGWGRALERRAEAPALRRADVIACGSDLVAEDVMRLVRDERRIMITPTGVDLALFQDAADRDAARASLGLTDRFVVGWSGSFRAFHALDQLVEAAAQLGHVTVLFVGDGPERPRVQALAEARGVDARFTGSVPHHRVPALLSAMDVGVALARADEPFHYSPLKLAEYLAAGLPTVAPSAPHLVRQIGEQHGVTFVEAGDVASLATRLRELRDDPAARAAEAARARVAAEAWSWDSQVVRVRARIAEVTAGADQQIRTK